MGGVEGLHVCPPSLLERLGEAPLAVQLWRKESRSGGGDVLLGSSKVSTSKTSRRIPSHPQPQPPYPGNPPLPSLPPHTHPTPPSPHLTPT